MKVKKLSLLATILVGSYTSATLPTENKSLWLNGDKNEMFKTSEMVMYSPLRNGLQLGDNIRVEVTDDGIRIKGAPANVTYTVSTLYAQNVQTGTFDGETVITGLPKGRYMLQLRVVQGVQYNRVIYFNTVTKKQSR